MPQFDFATYSAQIFWLAVCFSCLYFFLSKIILPRIGAIVENRKSIIKNALDSAGSLDGAIEELKEKSEKILKEAGLKQKESLDAAFKDAVLKREKALEESKDK